MEDARLAKVLLRDWVEAYDALPKERQELFGSLLAPARVFQLVNSSINTTQVPVVLAQAILLIKA